MHHPRCPIAMLVALFTITLALLAGCSSPSNTPNQDTTSDSQQSSQPASTPAPKPRDPSDAAPSITGALSVKGTQLLGDDGQPVQLRGVSTHGLAWFSQYVNQPFFHQLRQDWNANVVRLALYTADSGGYCTDGDRAKLTQLIEDGIDQATNADLYVIVDWHILSDNNPLAHVDDAKTFFSTIAEKYAHSTNIIYEICNEPNGDTTWDDVKNYANQVIPVIRQHAPNAVILVGTPNWSQRVDEAAASPLGFDNIMYTLHFYAATHQQDLRDTLSAANKAGIPIFVSEFGICDASGSGTIDYASANAWVDLMDSLDISYVCWNLSNKNEASALFKPDCTKTSDFATDDLSAEGLWLWETLHGQKNPKP